MSSQILLRSNVVSNTNSKPLNLLMFAVSYFTSQEYYNYNLKLTVFYIYALINQDIYDAQNYGMLHRYLHIPVYYLNIESFHLFMYFFENESAFHNVINQHSTLFLYLNISDIAFLYCLN